MHVWPVRARTATVVWSDCPRTNGNETGVFALACSKPDSIDECQLSAIGNLIGCNPILAEDATRRPPWANTFDDKNHSAMGELAGVPASPADGVVRNVGKET
jgi:hypothetical protein